MSDDADDDDPQLTSLRAVWLSMPDEEPPQRGLAELMAAARTKAEEMATPSLWERIVALLRRPPVLALATVLVLIGGAVFIGQRRDAMESEGPAVAPEQQQLREQANLGSAEATEPVLAQPVAPAPADEPAATAGSSEPEKNAEPPATPPRVNRRTAATRPAEKAATTRGATTRFDDGKKEARDKAFEMKLEGDRGGGETSLSSDRFASPPPEAKTQAEKQAPRVDAKPRVEAKPAADAEAPSEAVVGGAAAEDRPASTTSTTGTASRTSQYVAQAKSAAKRGDCGAAKMMMKRVAGEDAAAYRSALAGDAALRKCVGVPAAQ